MAKSRHCSRLFTCWFTSEGRCCNGFPSSILCSDLVLTSVMLQHSGEDDSRMIKSHSFTITMKWYTILGPFERGRRGATSVVEIKLIRLTDDCNLDRLWRIGRMNCSGKCLNLCNRLTQCNTIDHACMHVKNRSVLSHQTLKPVAFQFLHINNTSITI